jgi:hypothetical protein
MTGRNFSIDQMDVTAGARLQRGRPSRYRLQRRFGGIAVKKRLTTKGWMARTGGTVLIAVGMAGFVLGLLTGIHTTEGRSVVLMLAGGQAMILGTILYCYQQLLIRSVQNEEALGFQYDIGYEAGWQECDRAGKPVLVDICRDRKEVIHN